MTHTPGPWYTPRPQQQPVPHNPYAHQGQGPPGPPPGPYAHQGQGPPGPPRRRRFGRGPVAVIVAVVLLMAGGGVYALTGGDGEHESAAPVVAGTPEPSATEASSSPPASSTPTPDRFPTSAEINAARKPGDATAWVVDDPTDLPRGNILANDLWIVGDTVVQAVHKKVTARRLSDGSEAWSLKLPSTVCETPVNPTPDGKVVLLHHNRAKSRCNQLQEIDLRTGKAGWHKELTETGSMDGTIIVHSAISGGTLAIVQSMRAAAYRISDGAKLYDIPKEKAGGCYPDDVAGGRRLVVSYGCAIGSKTPYSTLRGVDPLTGRTLWRYRTQPGWEVGKVLSVEPVVFTTLHAERRTEDWRVVSLGPGGKLRRTIDARPKGFKHCADSGDAGQGIQNCRGALVGNGLVALGGTDRVGAYDLGTGRLVWGVKSENGPALHPLHMVTGKAALVYEAATTRKPGRILRIGPGSADTEKEVLRHPVAAKRAEYDVFAGNLAYAKDRIIITPTMVNGDDAQPHAEMISFAPGGN
ncbi:PQQ-binding-like beta-propeller repeat protein [Streptomyces sp. NPDC096323]|uniref:outer membrane protein assembly factor BamB family protein n=1 Tax=Streptomyces sp. NPDC096323 TaxID=3155822 RepID=UPI00332761F2